MKIVIEAIPHHEHRCCWTAGDCWTDLNGVDHIRVSALPDARMELLVVMHEFVEFVLCQARGITEPDILEFDLAHPEEDKPGALADAPHHKEHMTAETFERALALCLGVSWTRYCETIEGLFAE